jgi:hypothetical protein
MIVSRNVRRSFLALSAVAFAACVDAPTRPTVMGDGANEAASAQAQDRLEALFQRVSPAVMDIPGTVFADNDEVAGKLVFGIENENAARGVAARLRAMGVSDSDYAFEVTAPIVNAATLRDVWRPTLAGIQIHFTRYVCTLGFNVDHAGGRSFITNSHCTATQGGTEGTLYYQSSSSLAPTPIATEVDDPAYLKGGSCPKGKKCRWSDASRALYESAAASNRGEIAKTVGVNSNSLTTAATPFTITAQDASTSNFGTGTVMNKVGRTTGWTQGPVQRTCTNTSVSGSTVYLYCQTFVTAGVAGGDSGSPVFRITSGDNVTLVGILWGGASDNSYFVMSPLKQIVQEIGAVNAVK